MSFASRAREEIAQRSLQKDCCVRAAAYGFACFAKYFDKGGLVLQTEQPHTVQLARELFARCGVQGDVLEKQRPSGVLYEFNIRAPEQVARMHELFGTTGSETSLQIDPARPTTPAGRAKRRSLRPVPAAGRRAGKRRTTAARLPASAAPRHAAAPKRSAPGTGPS